MKIGNLISYKKGFELIRSISIVLIVCTFGFAGFVYYLFINKAKETSEKIYVMDKLGNTTQATAVPVSQVREWQISAAVKRAYTLCNSFDKNSFSSNIEAALEYFDSDCGKRLLKDYDDKNMLFELRDKQMDYRAQVIDCKINYDTKKGVIVGIQTISQNGVGIKRNLNVSFIVNDITPSEKNPEGVNISNYSVINDLVIE